MLTPNAKVDSCELRNVIRPACSWSENRSDQNTKYNDKVAIKIA